MKKRPATSLAERAPNTRRAVGGTEDGISKRDWDRVHAGALAVANARGVLDQHTAHIHDLLDELISRYGDLPSLLDTKADYTEDTSEALHLRLRAHERATDMELGENLVIISASLASLYIEEVKEPDEAARWCDELRRHLRRSPSTSYRAELASLRSQIRSLRRQRRSR